MHAPKPSMSEGVTVYGTPGSSYVQAVRLGLYEKGVPYRLQPVDFTTFKFPPYTTEMHPFGRIPVFDHGSFRIYETQAILRYIDDAFVGPALQPTDPERRARMNQAVGVLENYSLGCIHGRGSINYYRAVAPGMGLPFDEAAVAMALPRARVCLSAFDALLEGRFFGGGQVTLADLMVAPVLFVLEMNAEGRVLLGERPRLLAWLAEVKGRWSTLDVLMAP